MFSRFSSLKKKQFFLFLERLYQKCSLNLLSGRQKTSRCLGDLWGGPSGSESREKLLQTDLVVVSWFSRKGCGFLSIKEYPFSLGCGILLLGARESPLGQLGIHVLGRTGECTVFCVLGLMPASDVSSSLFPELKFSDCC